VAVRCLIVDDNGDFLEAARELLQREGVDVVGVASNSSEALHGNESGFDLARRLAARADDKDGAVILISTYAERDLADVIATSPALGFLSKSDLSRRAIDALLAKEH
jgi:two-component system nitrate/nitrite response regulator NarL